MSGRVDITGQTYGRLTAVRDVGSGGKRGRLWEFRCSCGNTIARTIDPIRQGLIQSCGCLFLERTVTMGKANRIPLERRFQQNVDRENRPMPASCTGFGPCLLWTGRADTKGRAQLHLDDTTQRASHIAWFLEYGYWPEYLMHRCDNPMCVAIDHLLEGDDQSNQYDRVVKNLGGVMVP